MRKRNTSALLALTALGATSLGFSAIARADVGPSTYRTIDVTGDPSQFDGIPAAATNAADPNATIDPISIQFCNDMTKLYLKINYATSVNPNSDAGVFLAIDSDGNPSTGFHTYGSPAIGSNLGFQNASAFTEAGDTTAPTADNPQGVSENQNFNSGGTVTSASAPNNLYAASPYNVPTLYQMIALPLDLTQVDKSTSGYSAPDFIQGVAFVLEVYTSPTDNTPDHPDDTITLGTATYTLATAVDAPEPASLGVIAFGGLMLARRRRRA